MRANEDLISWKFYHFMNLPHQMFERIIYATQCHQCHSVSPSDICVISDSGACATPGVDGGKAVSLVVLTHRLVVGELPGRLSLCTCHPATCCSLATTSRASTKDSGTPPPSCAAFQNTNRRRSRKCFVIPMNGELDKGGRAHA